MVFKRIRRGVKADAFYGMFRALAKEAEFEYTMVDGKIVRVLRTRNSHLAVLAQSLV